VNPSAADLSPALRVLGIDPGLADIGWGLIDWDARAGRARLVDYGVVQTPAGLALPERLAKIHRDLAAIVARAAPAVVAVEELFFAKNVKTAMGVAHGRAACILAAAPGRQLVEYTPLQIKKALTGSGRAGKQQVQMMVRALLGLKEIPRPDHAADALGAALCHVHSLALAGKLAAARTAAAPANGKTDAVNPLKALLAQSRRPSRRRRR
jgi:crossover junction endodeoxyribonuclease RuvC